jgi:Undecaprenyl-phosphate glucose phosphotransferase
MNGNDSTARIDSISAADVSAIVAERASSAPRELSALARAIAAEPVPQAVSAVVVTGIVRACELIGIATLGIAIFAMFIRETDVTLQYLVADAGIALGAVALFQASGLYSMQTFRTQIYQLSRIVAVWTIVFLIALTVAFFVKFEVTLSRTWAAAFYGVGLIALLAGRCLMISMVRRWAREGRLVRRVVVVGGGKGGEALIEALSSEADTDLRICGLFDDRGDSRSQDVVGGIPKLGNVDDLVEFTRQTRVDLILVSLPMTAENRVLQMVRKLWVLPVDVRLAAHMNKLRFRPRAYSYIGNVPVLDIFDKPIADWNMVVKSAFDRVVGFFILLAALPIMLLTALAVKFDSAGPIFFRQKRYGFNNELIEVWKFRSLHHAQSDATASTLVGVGDSRVTRVGRFIRKTSLDELPQLFNVVFFGNLSLVGPRPHALNAKAETRLYEEAVDGYFARHRVKPGITGWAQINGWRGNTDTQEKIQQRIEHDLYYIENWSLVFDIFIVLRTPFALLKAENAH